MKIRKIEVDFPIEVDLSSDVQQELQNLVMKICKANCPPNHAFWPMATGSKPTFIPMTAEDEQEGGMEFDDSIYHIECGIRQRYHDEKEN
jgi:hypothetical protein